MNVNTDYYEVLGISEDADEKAVKKAYKSKLKLYHTDSYRNIGETEKKKLEELFNATVEAYHVLSNTKQRKEYDLSRGKRRKTDFVFQDYDPPIWTANKKSSNHKASSKRKSQGYGNYNFQSFHFQNTENKTTKTNTNFDEIKSIEEEIYAKKEEIAKLFAEYNKLRYAEDEINYQTQLKQFEDTLKASPQYQDAQNFIVKMYNKDKNRITSLFISKKNRKQFEECKAYLNDVNEKIQEEEKRLNQEQNQKAKEKREKERTFKCKIEKLEDEKKKLQTKYKTHPLYASYEVHKMTIKKSKTNSNNTKKGTK